MARFGKVITAMVTPFDDEGALDLDAAASLARWLQDQGNEALVVAGTTGEAPVLTDPERLDLVEAVAQAVTIPVIAGSGTNDTLHSIHMTRGVVERGASAILAVCPYYNRPSQAGIEAHIRAIADVSDLPVVVYDIPVRAGRKISSATLLRLAREVPTVVALKDAAGNPGETAAVLAKAPDGFEVYSGDDSMTLPLLAIGAVGVIGVATHWTAPDHHQMFRCWDAGDTAGARRVNARLVDSFAYETGDDAPNPIPTKAMMNLLGQRVGNCRLPMGPPPDWVIDRAKTVHADLEAARAAWPES